MPGKIQLQGGALARALRLLEDTASVFERHDLPYWLDGGTLLGVVREGRLLPWDTDIDLGIRADDYPLLKRCLPALFLKGYRLRIRRYRHATPPFTRGTPRLVKVRTRGWWLRAPVVLDVFLVYRSADRYLFTLGNRDQQKRVAVPARFYDNLARIDFNGRRYSVPVDCDGYLAHRYGDWRTPVTQWSCFDDDRAIVG